MTDSLIEVAADGTATALLVQPANVIEVWSQPSVSIEVQYAGGTFTKGDPGDAGDPGDTGPAAPTGNRFVALGDSNSTGTNLSWPLMACGLSMQRLSYAGNGGVSGDNSTQILARVSTVLALGPRIVAVMAGTNDLSQGVTFATWSTKIKAIVAALKAAGVRVLLCTIPPRGNTTYLTTQVDWNNWLRRFALDNGLDLIDVFALLVDPATSMFKAGYDSGDQVHLSQAAHVALGQHVATVVQTTAYTPLQARLATDAQNLLANPILTVGTPAPGSWIPGGGMASGFTEGLVTDADFDGKAWQIDVTSSDGAARQFDSYTVAPGSGTYQPGDKLLFTCRTKIVSSTMPVGASGLYFSALFYGSTFNIVTPIAAGVAVHGVALHAFELIVPAGTNNIQMSISTNGAAAGAAIQTRIGNFGVFNLSKIASTAP